ncbi:MAG: cell division protein ZapA [Firmicutes bacterium]|nr:cell division protein ZapA [Bacillota bacterium]
MDKYDIEIGDIAMTVKTDENEDFVRFVVDELNAQLSAMLSKNPHCTKLEAALLSALEYDCERIRLEKKVKNLEAQVALYTANVNRLKAENQTLRRSAESANNETDEKE